MKYEKPNMDVIEFKIDDVLTTSGDVLDPTADITPDDETTDYDDFIWN